MKSFVKYRGHTLRELSSGTGKILLKTTDPQVAAKLSFEEYKPGNFCRWVPNEDVDFGWRETYYATYRGREFLIVFEEGDKLILDTMDMEEAREFGFEPVDKGIYEKTVRKTDVESVRRHTTMYRWNGTKWESV